MCNEEEKYNKGDGIVEFLVEAVMEENQKQENTAICSVDIGCIDCTLQC